MLVAVSMPVHASLFAAHASFGAHTQTVPSVPSDDAPSAPTAEPTDDSAGFTLAAGGPEERAAINRLANAGGWPSRAIAVMRLERYDCKESAELMMAFARDRAWQVRAYAYACLARRGIAVDPTLIALETDPRALRALVRSRQPIDRTTLDTRIARLEKSPRPLEAMIALETLAALDRHSDFAIRKRMDELLERIVLRMDRTEAGVLSNRLSDITGGRDAGRDYRWREWWRKNRTDPKYRACSIVPTPPAGTRLTLHNRIASLDGAAFVSFDQYLSEVADRPMDLAILIDCTASMGREIAGAQGGIDDLMNFLGNVTKGVRVAIIGYRDRGGDWETKAWDFTASLDEARTRLWSLSAEGGGDEPESVYAAMKLALQQCTWLKDPPAPSPPPIRACVLVGDAPPHIGEGTLCVKLAARGLAAGVRFYGLVAREENIAIADEPDAPSVEGLSDESSTEESPQTAPTGVEGQIDPPKRPPPVKATAPTDTSKSPGRSGQSKTWFPEIAKAGGGRAEVLREHDELAAEIAQLAIADRYREEFGDFFAAFRLLCR
jgi:hypothetical protein